MVERAYRCALRTAHKMNGNQFVHFGGIVAFTNAKKRTANILIRTYVVQSRKKWMFHSIEISVELSLSLNWNFKPQVKISLRISILNRISIIYVSFVLEIWNFICAKIKFHQSRFQFSETFISFGSKLYTGTPHAFSIHHISLSTEEQNRPTEFFCNDILVNMK